MPVLYGCDIHPQFQKDISPKRIKNEGFEFLIVKLSQGRWQYLPAAYDYASAGRDAGLTVGYYHFLDSDNPAAQARQFAKRTEKAREIGPTILVCDFEDPKDYGQRMRGAPSFGQLVNFVRTLREEVGPDQPIGIYSAGVVL